MKKKLKARMPITKKTAKRLALGLCSIALVAVVAIVVNCAGKSSAPMSGEPFWSSDGCETCYRPDAGDWDCDPIDIYAPDCEGGEWE